MFVFELNKCFMLSKKSFDFFSKVRLILFFSQENKEFFSMAWIKDLVFAKMFFLRMKMHFFEDTNNAF